jgi:DNA-binding CsgD family transcriptional regulator/PAS domain-containing protein
MALDTARFSNLVENLYAAVLDGNLWKGIAKDVAELCGTHSTAIQVRDLKSGTVRLVSRTPNLDEATDKAYTSYYFQHDVWATLGMESGRGGVIRGETLISGDQLVKTEFYQDFLRKLDIFQIIGSVFRLGDDHVGMIGVHRGRSAPSFDETQQKNLGSVLTHLQRSLQLRQKFASLPAESASGVALPEEDGLSVLLVDSNGRLLQANAAAEALLKAGDALKIIDGCISVHHVRTSLRLQRLIKDAAQSAALRSSSAGGLLTVPRADRFPLAVMVAPFHAAIGSSTAPVSAALVMIRDPAQSAELNAQLQGLFGLTPAEAKIANGLAGGASIEQIAVKHGLSHHTVRTQLKSISAKTGTSRQGELIALILKATTFPKVGF